MTFTYTFVPLEPISLVFRPPVYLLFFPADSVSFAYTDSNEAPRKDTHGSI